MTGGLVSIDLSQYLHNCEILANLRLKLYRKVPPLPQRYFVLLWKTLYAVFLGHNEMPESDSEQATYHAVSVVGTLLLQIGEVGSKIDKQLKLGDGDSGDNNNENEWKITFEQFLASILTETALVEHLSQKVNLEEALKSFGPSDSIRSSSVETSSKSVFYV